MHASGHRAGMRIRIGIVARMYASTCAHTVPHRAYAHCDCRAHVCIHAYTHVDICSHVCAHTLTCAHAYMHTCMQTDVHTPCHPMHICIEVVVLMHATMHTHLRVCVCGHVCAHTRTHANMHTCMQEREHARCGLRVWIVSVGVHC